MIWGGGSSDLSSFTQHRFPRGGAAGRRRAAATTQLTPKQQAHELLKQLPDNATWDELEYEVVVRRSIERGLADADVGRLTEIKDIRREFGLAE